MKRHAILWVSFAFLICTMIATSAVLVGNTSAAHAAKPVDASEPTLVITPTQIGIPGDGTNCSTYKPPVTCTITLSEPADAQDGLSWSATTSTGDKNSTISPSWGTLSPGESITVTITTSLCGGRWSYYFTAEGVTTPVVYSCG